MRNVNPADIRATAVALFYERGVTAANLDSFDAVALARITSDIVASLNRTYGVDAVTDFVNASFASGGVASMLACGPRAQATRRHKRM